MSVPILSYHSLDDSGSVISTSPDWFFETMNALHTEGFRCLDLHHWIAAGRPSLARSFAITFDDGLASMRAGAEILARFGFAATVFLVPGRIGRDNTWPGQPSGIPRKRLLDWHALRDMHSAGFRFGAHTVNHPWLGRLSPGELRAEIVDSRDRIEQQIGESCPLFTYPYGDAPQAAREIVADEFLAGFGTTLGYATTLEDRSHMSRVDAYYLRTPKSLRRLLSETWRPHLRVIRAARSAKRLFAIA